MSDYRAIQGVTTSLKKLLETYMYLNRGEVATRRPVPITVGLPDAEGSGGRRINVFLI